MVWRMLMNLAAVTSVALCVAVAGMWAESYRRNQLSSENLSLRLHHGPRDDGLELELTSWGGYAQLMYVRGPRYLRDERNSLAAEDRWGLRLAPSTRAG